MDPMVQRRKTRRVAVYNFFDIIFETSLELDEKETTKTSITKGQAF
jgi:hypothetical protein